MEIVIEYVLLDNFCVDAMLLYSSNKILRLPTNWWGIVVASFLGAVFALLSPLINMDGALIFLAKFLVAFVMVFVSCFCFYKIFLRYIVFVLLTFLFGGVLIAFCYFLGISVLNGATIMHFSSVPLGTILGACVGLIFVCLRLFNKVYIHLKYTKFMCKVCLTINQKTRVLDGFLDSGNMLKTKDNLPVVILKEEELKHWFGFDDRMRLLMGEFSGVRIKNPQKMEIKSVGSKTKILVFDADNLQVENRNFDVAVGIDNSHNFKNFLVLLNKKIGEVLC